MKRSTRALWRVVVAITLVVILIVGGGIGAAIQFGGYCAADFIPGDAKIAAAPYVQNVTSSTATIMWRTTEKSTAVVAYGPTSALGQVAETGSAEEVQAVQLAGLQPDTEYFYHVQGKDTAYPVSSFWTAPGPEATVTAAVVGDTGSGEEPQYEVAEVIRQMDPRLVLHTGDVVYPRGGTCHYDDRHYEPYEPLIASVPIYPVLGNHDVRSENGEPYLTAFDLPAGDTGTERFYSFDYGPMHIVALDSELYYSDESIPTEVQKAWLRRDLRSTDRPWTVVVIHRPPFNSSPFHGGDKRVLEDLVGIFEEGVDIVFAGHEHVYERLAPIDGVTYVVTGGGGAGLRGAGVSELTVISELRYHAVKVEVSPDRLTVQAIDVDGAVFDEFELLREQG